MFNSNPQITNTVVSTQSANITLALGASPIMATSAKEMQDLSKIPGALLVNIGTLVDDTKEGMLASGESIMWFFMPYHLDRIQDYTLTWRESPSFWTRWESGLLNTGKTQSRVRYHPPSKMARMTLSCDLRASRHLASKRHQRQCRGVSRFVRDIRGVQVHHLDLES